MTPQEKLQLVVAASAKFTAMLEAQTGLHFDLDVNLHPSSNQDTQADSILAAAFLGFDRQEFSNHPSGGNWQQSGKGYEVNIFDNEMVHLPSAPTIQIPDEIDEAAMSLATEAVFS